MSLRVEESEESDSSNGEGDDSTAELTLDGSDESSFDASWNAISDALPKGESQRFDVAVVLAVFDELSPESSEKIGKVEVDSAEVLKALDGKTPEQVVDRAGTQFREMSGIDINDMTARGVDCSVITHPLR